MENFIQIVNNGYTVKISLQNLIYQDIEGILEQIGMYSANWWNFCMHDKLWYCDGSKFLNCEAVNHEEKVIIFG